MNIIFYLVVLYFSITNLCVCAELKESFQIQDLSQTNLTYDSNYFIRLSSSNTYLRYDSNDNGNISGLAYVSQTNLINSTDESLIRPYIFKIERDVNSMIKIKNIRTNRYISYYSSTYGFILANSSSSFNNSLRLVLHLASNTLSIVSASASSSPYLYSSSAFVLNLWVNRVSPSSSSAALQFIAAPNITESSPPGDIGDTNVTYGDSYFIKYSTTNNYIRWDGNSNGDESGLLYILQNDITNITDEAEKDAYLFVVEPDIYNMVKLRNVRTNRYLSYNSYYLTGYVLSDDNSYNSSFRLIFNPETNSIYFAHYDSYYGSYYYITSGHAFSSSLFLYYLQRSTSSGYYFQFIRSTQSPTTTTTSTSITTTTPSITTTISSPTPTPCLPSNYIFRADISSFQYEIPDPNVVDEKTEALILIPRTVINNTSPGSITEKILYKENIEETYNWFYPSLNELNIRIEQKRVTLPPIVRRNISFRNGKQHIVDSLDSNNNIEVVYNRELSIDRTVEVKPRTSIDYMLYADYITSLEFNFSALAKISGNDTSGNQLNGIALNDLLQTCANFTVVEIKEKYISVEVNGLLVADLISGFFFEVNSDSSDDIL